MDSFQLVKASAGSGKTRALVVRYLSLLFLEQPSSKILALTFTNKAVEEMKDRIISVIYNLNSHMDYVEEISSLTKISTKEILSKQEEVLEKFLNDSANILTLDKFFNKILRLFCWYDDTSIDFNITANMQDGDFLNYFLGHIDDSDIQNIFEISKLLDISISQIISLFFVLLDKDSDIKDLIDTHQIRDNDIEDKIFSKIDKLKKIVEDNQTSSASAKKALVGLITPEAILKTTWMQKDSLQEYSYFKKIYTSEMDDEFFALKDLLQEYCNQKQNIFLSKLLLSYSKFKSIKKKYQKFNNELTFSDVTNSIYKILNNSVNTEFLYFRLDTKISHILIDEFQDTSILQYKILKPLIDEILSGDGYKSLRTLFFVGDDKQSIYRFRGAKKELIEKISHNEQIQTSALGVNYRSDIAIVGLVNKIFSKLYTDYREQKCNSLKEGYVNVSFTSKEELGASLCSRVQKMFDSGYSPNDITILSFKNKDLLLVDDWLRKEFDGIKTITDINSKLIHYPKVKAIIEFINYLYFRDEIYLLNFLSIISHSSLSLLRDEADYIYERYQKSNYDIGLLLLSVVQKYQLYDDNTLVFLEQSSGFKDIVDFVYNIANMQTNITSSALHGIRLSTIHKSKGLDFANVILLDQISGDGRDSGKLLFDYDSVDLQKVYLKISNRDIVDEPYKIALQKEKKSSRQDLINSLYVAITRAKNSISIIQKDKGSKFDVLDLQEECVGSLKKEVQKHSAKKDISEQKLDIELKNYGLQKDFLHKNEDNIEYESNIESIQNMEYGNAVHYMFESLHYLDCESIDTAYELTKNKYGFNIDSTSLKSIKTIVSSCVKNNDFIQLISNKAIKKEISFKYNQQVGVIDLLLEDDEYTYIVDYKTSSIDSLSNYASQIKFYKNAMEHIYKKPSIGYLFFVKDNLLKKMD